MRFHNVPATRTLRGKVFECPLSFPGVKHRILCCAKDFLARRQGQAGRGFPINLLAIQIKSLRSSVLAVQTRLKSNRSKVARVGVTIGKANRPCQGFRASKYLLFYLEIPPANAATAPITVKTCKVLHNPESFLTRSSSARFRSY